MERRPPANAGRGRGYARRKQGNRYVRVAVHGAPRDEIGPVRFESNVLERRAREQPPNTSSVVLLDSKPEMRALLRAALHVNEPIP